MLECLLGAILVDLGTILGSRGGADNGNSASRRVPGRLGNGSLCSCPCWLRFGSLPDLSWTLVDLSRTQSRLFPNPFRNLPDPFWTDSRRRVIVSAVAVPVSVSPTPIRSSPSHPVVRTQTTPLVHRPHPPNNQTRSCASVNTKMLEPSAMWAASAAYPGLAACAER